MQSSAAINGIRIHYLEQGEGYPIFLLHGWPEWSRVWLPVMERLAGRFRLIAPDLRGFGSSQKPDPGPSQSAGPGVHAADIIGLADALGIQRFGLVSHDIGSSVAQTIARQIPSRISGLFFFNCSYPGIGARWAEPRRLEEIWYQVFHQKPWAAELIGLSREACRIYFRSFLHHWAHKPEAFNEAVIEEWVDNFIKPGNLQGGFDWYSSVYQMRLEMAEGKAVEVDPIAIPTRVLWGKHDPVLLAEWADRLGDYFTNLEVNIEPDSGHFVHFEVPDRASADIASFFEARNWIET